MDKYYHINYKKKHRDLLTPFKDNDVIIIIFDGDLIKGYNCNLQNNLIDFFKNEIKVENFNKINSFKCEINGKIYDKYHILNFDKQTNLITIISKKYSDYYGDNNFKNIFKYNFDTRILKSNIDDICDNFLKSILNEFRNSNEIKIIKEFSCDERLYIINAIKDNNILRGALEDVTEIKDLINKNIQADKLRSLGFLSGGLAHELNNLLMTMMGNLELLKNKLNITDNKYVNNIEIAFNNATRIINNLLSFSNQNIPKLETIDLKESIVESIELLKHSFKKGYNIIIDNSSEELKIEGNKGLIKNLFINLCLNAIESLKDINDSIYIKTYKKYITSNPNLEDNEEFEKGHYAIIEIKDTGTGIKEDILKNVFEPFYSTKNSYNNLGLGLSMVLNTINLHNGYFTIDTKENEGTKIKIYFKIFSEKDLNKDFEILLVDDEELVRLVLKEMLELLGYNVKCFSDGNELVDYYKDNKDNIKLVLLDMIMPKINGDLVYKKLKEINKDLKIIIISGYTDEKISNLTDFNMNNYIQKPVSLDVLHKKVKEILL